MVLFAGTAATLLGGCAASNVSAADMQKRQQALAASDLLIVPGERIGPVRLGMGMDEVLSKLGRPDIVVDDEAISIWRYWSLSLTVSFDDIAAPVVRDINTMYWSDVPSHSVFKTAEGIGIGSSSFDVNRTYGSPDSGGPQNVMNYFSRGMQFGINDYAVSGIQISQSTRN